MNIKKKILLGFAAVLIMFALPTAYSIVNGFRIQERVSGLHNKIYAALDRTNQMMDGLRITKESLMMSISDSDDTAPEIVMCECKHVDVFLK